MMGGYPSRLLLKCIAVITLATLLSGCGRVSLSITDATIDTAEAVVLAFTGVELTPVSGDIVKVEFKPNRNIDLMTLTDGISEVLLDDEVLLQDKYDRVTLKLDMDASYVTVNGADFPVTIPTDALDGLQVDKEFEVKTGSDSQFTIDFDLRKSLLDPESGTDEYILRPVLRLVDNSLTGTITGNVDASLLSLNTACYDNSGAVTAVVYVFSGINITPDDIDGDTTEPMTSARLKDDLSYTAAFLEEGDYTLSLTCEAINDEPDTDDNINFLRNQTITVVKAQDSTVDFGL